MWTLLWTTSHYVVQWVVLLIFIAQAAFTILNLHFSFSNDISLVIVQLHKVFAFLGFFTHLLYPFWYHMPL